MAVEKNADVFILFDRSGSMAQRLIDAQGGYDTFIKEQKKADGTRYICLWDFDDQHRLVYELTPAEKIPVGDEKDAYTLVPRGSTALMDAITRIIAYADSHRNSDNQTFVVIQTDGYENASRESSADSVKALIESKIAEGWQFIYLGANQDAITIAKDFGIPVASAATYDMSHAVTTSGGVAAMMSTGLRGGGYGFTAQQRKDFVGGNVTASQVSPSFVTWVGDSSEYDPEPLVKL